MSGSFTQQKTSGFIHMIPYFVLFINEQYLIAKIYKNVFTYFPVGGTFVPHPTPVLGYVVGWVELGLRQ